MNIAQAVKEWRKKNKYTQEEIAEAAGMKQPQYARLETGKFGFKAEHIKQIAETFNADANELLGIEKKQDFKS